MALLEKVKASLGVTSSRTDESLQLLIGAALDDMARVGVRSELLSEDSMSPQASWAVVAYCRAFYNVDSIQSPFFLASYKATVTSLMNSDRSDYLYEEADDGDESSSGDDAASGAGTSSGSGTGDEELVVVVGGEG